MLFRSISMEELVQLFTVERVNSSPARFDMKKLEAINGDKIRALTLEDFLAHALPFLVQAGVIKGEDKEVALVKRALPLIQERIARMKEVVPMLRFLFVDSVEIESESKVKMAEDSAQHVLERSLSVLEPLDTWSHEAIEEIGRAHV